VLANNLLESELYEKLELIDENYN